MSNRIIVVGSMNMDMVVKTSHIPQPGETVLGGSFFMNPGGKGANQAVSAARLGGDVSFVGRIGDDIFGKQSSQLFDEEGIEAKYVISDDESPSGIALITVDINGENSIVVAPGANYKLTTRDVKYALDKCESAKILLIQLEIPMPTVEFAVEYARSKDMKVILNPAPMNERIVDSLSFVDIITPNVNEASVLSGIEITDIDSARSAAKIIHAKGPKCVIITLGREGALLLEDGNAESIAAPTVDAVDTTAAGDVFNGALAVAVAEGRPLAEATALACEAASISVTRMGAQQSIPFRNEVLLNAIK